MAAIAGTIQHVSILNTGSKGGINAAKVVVDFGAYAAASDSAAVNALTTAIQNCRRNGKTVTLRNVSTLQVGSDGTQDIYYGTSGTLTGVVSGANSTGDLTGPTGTKLTNTTATTTPVTLAVIFSEA